MIPGAYRAMATPDGSWFGNTSYEQCGTVFAGYLLFVAAFPSMVFLHTTMLGT